MKRAIRIELVNASKGKCAYCGECISPGSFEIDHKTPRSRAVFFEPGMLENVRMKVNCSKLFVLSQALGLLEVKNVKVVFWFEKLSGESEVELR